MEKGKGECSGQCREGGYDSTSNRIPTLFHPSFSSSSYTYLLVPLLRLGFLHLLCSHLPICMKFLKLYFDGIYVLLWKAIDCYYLLSIGNRREERKISFELYLPNVHDAQTPLITCQMIQLQNIYTKLLRGSIIPV